jgi:hypothetical protein
MCNFLAAADFLFAINFQCKNLGLKGLHAKFDFSVVGSSAEMPALVWDEGCWFKLTAADGAITHALLMHFYVELESEQLENKIAFLLV